MLSNTGQAHPTWKNTRRILLEGWILPTELPQHYLKDEVVDPAALRTIGKNWHGRGSDTASMQTLIPSAWVCAEGGNNRLTMAVQMPSELQNSKPLLAWSR